MLPRSILILLELVKQSSADKGTLPHVKAPMKEMSMVAQRHPDDPHDKRQAYVRGGPQLGAQAQEDLTSAHCGSIKARMI